MKRDDFSFEITEHLGTIKDAKWPVECNIISWNGREPVFDIRAWAPDHSKCGKGVSLDRDAMYQLYAILDDQLSDEIKEEVTA